MSESLTIMLVEEFSESENELLAEVRASIFSCTTRMKISNNRQIVKLLKTLFDVTYSIEARECFDLSEHNGWPGSLLNHLSLVRDSRYHF